MHLLRVCASQSQHSGHPLHAPQVQLLQKESLAWRYWCRCQVSGLDHWRCWCPYPWCPQGWGKPSSPLFLCLLWMPSLQHCFFSPAAWQKGRKWERNARKKVNRLTSDVIHLIKSVNTPQKRVNLSLTPDSDTNWSTNCHLRGSSEELEKWKKAI